MLLQIMIKSFLEIFNITSLFGLLVITFITASGEIKSDDLMTKVFISGTDGYDTYRIPAIVVTEKGTIIAFCEGRKDTGGDSGDIDILFKRSFDKGKTWSRQQTIWDDGGNTCGNPCPIVDRKTGSIHLLMTWNRGDEKEKEITLKESFKLARLVTYTCPMKCTEPAGHPGECAKCGMSLKRTETIYACPMHKNVTSRDTGDKCWICGMELTTPDDVAEKPDDGHAH